MKYLVVENNWQYDDSNYELYDDSCIISNTKLYNSILEAEKVKKEKTLEKMSGKYFNLCEFVGWDNEEGLSDIAEITPNEELYNDYETVRNLFYNIITLEE